MICPKCGAKLEEGTRVCPICGKSLVATSVGTVFKRRDLQEYDELSSDEYDDSDYQDDGSYEEEQYDDTYQDDEYDDGSYEEEQYDDGYEAESGPYDNENNEAYFSDQSDEKPVKKKSIANKILGGMILICLVGIAGETFSLKSFFFSSSSFINNSLVKPIPKLFFTNSINKE